jgi:hypothetical protein
MFTCAVRLHIALGDGPILRLRFRLNRLRRSIEEQKTGHNPVPTVPARSTMASRAP